MGVMAKSREDVRPGQNNVVRDLSRRSAGRAARPFPEDMPYHVEQLTVLAKTPAAVELSASLVARALVLDYAAPEVHRPLPLATPHSYKLTRSMISAG